MMMNRPDLFKQESRSARNLSDTLRRFGEYFGKFWYMLVFALVLIIVSTWTQVTTPELTGQATDCFLIPAGAAAFEGFGSFSAEAESQQAGSTCYLTTDNPSSLSLSRKIGRASCRERVETRDGGEA